MGVINEKDLFRKQTLSQTVKAFDVDALTEQVNFMWIEIQFISLHKQQNTTINSQGIRILTQNSNGIKGNEIHNKQTSQHYL
jgi:hypothetical protein